MTQTEKKEKQKKRFEENINKGSSFVPEELIQAFESGSNKFTTASPSNPWTNCNFLVYLIVRPFSVKSRRAGTRPKDESTGKNITDFPDMTDNDKVTGQEITDSATGNPSAFPIEAISGSLKSADNRNKGTLERPKTEMESDKKAKSRLTDEERVNSATNELDKVWKEFEAMAAESNKKKQKLQQEPKNTPLVEETKAHANIKTGGNYDKGNMKGQTERMAKEETKSQKPIKEEARKVELSEEEIERKSKENLAQLEKKLKALDSVKEGIFNELTEYITKIKTAKDENGELLLRDGDKIDDLATIMKDYQREAWTSFDKSSIPGLITGEEGIRMRSATNVQYYLYPI